MCVHMSAEDDSKKSRIHCSFTQKKSLEHFHLGKALNKILQINFLGQHKFKERMENIHLLCR